MARTVREIMNPQLVSLRAGACASEALEMILEFGITAVPVLDGEGRPIGVTSLRDVVRLGPEKAPMTSPATTIAANASVAAAAETMATSNRHHLVVVGSDGCAVGMVSTLDVIRALIGRLATHPATFARYDAELDGSWSSDEMLASDRVASIPNDPGVLVLLRSGVEADDAVVWVEASDDLAARVRALAGQRPDVPPVLAQTLGEARVCFRYMVMHDEHARQTAARRLRDRLDHVPPRGAT